MASHLPIAVVCACRALRLERPPAHASLAAALRSPRAARGPPPAARRARPPPSARRPPCCAARAVCVRRARTTRCRRTPPHRRALPAARHSPRPPATRRPPRAAERRPPPQTAAVRSTSTCLGYRACWQHMYATCTLLGLASSLARGVEVSLFAPPERPASLRTRTLASTRGHVPCAGVQPGVHIVSRARALHERPPASRAAPGRRSLRLPCAKGPADRGGPPPPTAGGHRRRPRGGGAPAQRLASY